METSCKKSKKFIKKNCRDKNVQKSYFLSFHNFIIIFVTNYHFCTIYNNQSYISVKYEPLSVMLTEDIQKNEIFAFLLLSRTEQLFLNVFI